MLTKKWIKKYAKIALSLCIVSGVTASAAEYSFTLAPGGFKMSNTAKKTNTRNYATINSVNTKSNIVDNNIRFRILESSGSNASEGHRYVGIAPMQINYTIEVFENTQYKLRGHTTESSASTVSLSGTWTP